MFNDTECTQARFLSRLGAGRWPNLGSKHPKKESSSSCLSFSQKPLPTTSLVYTNTMVFPFLKEGR